MLRKIGALLNPKERKLTVEFARRENMKGLYFLVYSTILACSFSIIVQAFSIRSYTFEPTALELIAAICCLLYTNFRKKDPIFDTCLALYLAGAVIAVLAILGDTRLNAGEYAFQAILLLGFLPQLIMDLPWHLLLYDACLAGFYIASECSVRNGLGRQMNIIRCIAVTAVSLSLAV